MSPVPPVFHTVVTVSIGLNCTSLLLDLSTFSTTTTTGHRKFSEGTSCESSLTRQVYNLFQDLWNCDYFGGWVEGPSKQADRTDGGWVQSTMGAKHL